MDIRSQLEKNREEEKKKKEQKVKKQKEQKVKKKKDKQRAKREKSPLLQQLQADPVQQEIEPEPIEREVYEPQDDYIDYEIPESVINTKNQWLRYTALAVMALTLIVAAAGVLTAGRNDVIPGLMQSLLAQDITILAVVMPVMAVFTLLWIKGRDLFRITLPALLYVILYTYIPFIFRVPLGYMTILYMVLSALTLAGLLFMVAQLDIRGLKRKFEFEVPRMMASVLLILLGLSILIIQAGDILAVLTRNAVGIRSDMSQIFVDMVIALPLIVVTGLLLMNRYAMGYVFSYLIFFAYLIQSVGDVLEALIQSRMTGTPVGQLTWIVVGVKILACLIMLFFYYRGWILAAREEED